MKYLTAPLVGIAFLVLIILPASVNTQTVEELQAQISELQDTLQDLQIKMKDMEEKTSNIPKIKVGREYRFLKSDIDQWVQKQHQSVKYYSFDKVS